MKSESGREATSAEVLGPDEFRMNGLRMDGLTVKRGEFKICRDVTLAVPAGEITVLLGANGAGKTTLLDAIAGVLPADSGTIELDGHRIHAVPPHRRAARGLAYIEQGRTVFSKLTVAQNLAVVDRSRQGRERAFELFPRLADKQNLRAGLLSGGEQQMLIIARALATGPRILLVDELSLGLAPRTTQTLMGTLSSLAASGMGILLVEQFAEMALQIGTTAHIMQRGRIVESESCEVLLRDRGSRIRDALFGT
ncbi:ABC transporter ATP-binding protein [Leucobacter sp. W1478]|uniref:ABC transporter ATP-binding protein n=1 Tax=Leucobacter sp. W1478 TaxID=3439065 RepID=UPI003F3D6962